MPHSVPIPRYTADSPGIGSTRDENPKHRKLADYVKRLITMSESVMASRWPQWQETDRRMRAFVDVSEVDKTTGRLRRPFDVKLVLPTSYAIKQSILTYWYTGLTTKNVLIPIEATKTEELRAANLMEEVLDFDMNSPWHNARLALYAWLNDAAQYGIGIVQEEWHDEFRRVTTRDQQPVELFGVPLGSVRRERREWKRIYSGNRTYNVDPYMFLPDPRVPAGRVQDGDFVGYTWWKSWTSLKQGERGGKYQNVDDIEKWSRDRVGSMYRQNARFDTMGLPQIFDVALGEEDRGFVFGHTVWVKIVPSDFDLGAGDDPELWVVGLGNYDTIIRCERWDYDHGEFPTSVIEPHYDGYSPLNLGVTEILQPLQDLSDWLVSAHMDNIKKAIHNMFLLDPSRWNLEDLQHPGPAKWLRLRESAWGSDVNQGFKQLDVQDVTRGHIADTQLIKEEMVRTSGTPEPMLGMQPRTKQQATVFSGMVQMASARHKVLLQIMSTMGIRPWGRRCVQNIQQFMDENTFVRITGSKAKRLGLDPYQQHILNVSPEDIQGAFDYPVHTGDIPPDPNRAVEVWKEILFGVARNPQLAQRFDLVEIFKTMVYNAGIKNIDAFLVKTQVMPDEQVMAQQQAGNLVPAQGVVGDGGGRGQPALARGSGVPGGGPGAVGPQSGVAHLLLGAG